MLSTQHLQEELALLPDSAQEELDRFVHQLQKKYANVNAEDIQWADFSLSAAMQGMETDIAYTIQDIKESW